MRKYPQFLVLPYSHRFNYSGAPGPSSPLRLLGVFCELLPPQEAGNTELPWCLNGQGGLWRASDAGGCTREQACVKQGPCDNQESYYLTDLIAVIEGTMLHFITGIWNSHISFSLPPYTQKHNSTKTWLTGNSSIFSASKKSRNFIFLKMKTEIRLDI